MKSNKLLKQLITDVMAHLNEGKSWVILNNADLRYVAGADGMLNLLECLGMIELTEYDDVRDVQYLKISHAGVDALDHWRLTENVNRLRSSIAALNSH